MRFGNSFATYRRGLIAMFVFGLVLDVVLTLTVPSRQALVANWPVLVLLPSVAVFPLIFISPTLIFSIHIEAGRVKHMFLDRHVLTDLPVSDFEDMLLAIKGGAGYQGRRMAERAGFTTTDFDRSSPGPWAATLYFKHGQKIRFFGAHMRILRSLKDALIAAKEQAKAGKL